MVRNVFIGLVVSGLALRYFYVAHQWRRSVELRAAARVHALQARIRPHFLFNSMNTIAALTRSNPRRAEGAVQDLADLFRATLSDKRDTITLAEELEVARTYQRMEQLRLGAAAAGRVEDRCATRATRWCPACSSSRCSRTPSTTASSRAPTGGTVTITGEVAGGLMTIVVRNPLDPGPGEREGNRLALANIRERLSPHVRRARADEVRALRCGVHRDAALSAAREAGCAPRRRPHEPHERAATPQGADRRRRAAGARAAAEPAGGDRGRRGGGRGGERPGGARPDRRARRRTWCCSTCACPAWTASRPRAT